jgi:HEAT repeat protein
MQPKGIAHVPIVTMKNHRWHRHVLLLVFLAVLTGCVAAQEFPATLVQAYPGSVEKLSSEDVAERASVLRELVFHVPQSCTMELALKYDLPREDYVFVVGKILEKDLRTLDEKTESENWTLLVHLITSFEMKQFAGAVAEYLDDPNWQIQAAAVRTIRQLKATGLDAKISPLLQPEHHPYVRQLTLDTLIEFRSKKATPALVSKLWSDNPSDRYWALDKIAEIGAVEAAPRVAERLRDDEPNIRYWAIETLARLNAKTQAPALWQFLKINTDKKQEGYAIATLVQFEQKEALPIVVDNLKAITAGSREYDILEFIRKLKPKFFIPTLISLYHTKTRVFPVDTQEEHFRNQILQLLFEYKTPLAIPIYRDNLIDKSSRHEGPSYWVAGLLYDLNAREALDDIYTSFTDLAKTTISGSNDDYRAGEFGLVLAKFGEKRTWPMLVDYLEKTKFYNREQIIIELNKHLDRKLWDETHAKKPSQKLGPVKTVVEDLGRESGIPVTMVDIPRSDVCSLEATDDPNAIACGYSDPQRSVHDSLVALISILNNRKRGEYTFVYDKGTIRILTTKDAVEFWKKNILTKL